MTERLFLDLDGTLIDPRRRLYTLFCELAPEVGLSFEDYWRDKRNRMSQREMLRKYLAYPDARIDAFHEAWMSKVEEPARLALDTPFPGVSEFLDRARQQATLCLITARQHQDRLAEQLYRFGWQDVFTCVLTTGQRQTKAAMIRAHCAYGADDALVGDTGEDILAGKELGMHTVAVASGALSEAILREYAPDRIVPTVADIPTDVPAFGITRAMH
jgi:phosphoglycolate phosphatase